jgi:membrane associated rhomboid family serine protease
VFPVRDLNPTRIIPVITILLIAANLFVFFGVQGRAEQGADVFLYRRAAIACEITTGDPLSPAEVEGGVCSSVPEESIFPEKSPWFAIFTSMFLHGSVAHALFNMWFLWIFGNNVEEAFGKIGYLVIYLVGGVAATLVFVFANPSSTVPLVGASGAIAAILGVYAVFFPGHRIISLVGIWLVPLPAALFLGIWFIAQFGLGGTNVAWEAHAGGFAFGLIAALFLRRRLVSRVY